MERVFTSIFVLLDAAGVLLLVRPSALLDFWTARRVPASDWDRFIARLVGAVILWLQIGRWAGQAQNGNLSLALNSLSILICAYAAAFLIYKLVRFVKSKHDDAKQTVQTAWDTVPSESEEEARARYHAAWQKYAFLRVAYPLLLLGWLPFAYILGAVFRFFRWNIIVCVILVLAWLPLMPVLGWQWSYWPCPRCGKAFKGKYPFFPKLCYYCNLPKWSESPNDFGR
jgi:hypothetical protein